MKLTYQALPIEASASIKTLCNDLMRFQKSKATIHPEWFDGMTYETRFLPSLQYAKKHFLMIAKDGETVIGYAYSNVASKMIYSGGFATLEPVDFFDFETVSKEDVGCLSQFYIAEAYRGKGVGRHLFEASQQWLDAQKAIEDVFIFVSNGNDEALKFYQRQGYKLSHTILNGFILVLRNKL